MDWYVDSYNYILPKIFYPLIKTDPIRVEFISFKYEYIFSQMFSLELHSYFIKKSHKTICLI